VREGGAVPGPPSLVGERSAEILRGVPGMSAEETARLRERGAI